MLKGQAALVLGAGRGVGRATAVALARENADLVVAGLGHDRLAETLAEVEACGVRGIAIGCDVSKEDEVSTTIDRVMLELGRLDIVVNTAVWMDPPGSLLEMSRADWDKTLAVDLTGAFLLSKHALRAMLPSKRGRLIHLSSEIATRGSTMRGAYAAAKAGVNSLVRSLALEVAHTDIKVNAICPMGIGGEHNREMRACFRELQGLSPESDAEYEAVRSSMMPPEDVAALAIFLCSPAGLRVNGQAFTIGEQSSSGGDAAMSALR